MKSIVNFTALPLLVNHVALDTTILPGVKQHLLTFLSLAAIGLTLDLSPIALSPSTGSTPPRARKKVGAMSG